MWTKLIIRQQHKNVRKKIRGMNTFVRHCIFPYGPRSLAVLYEHPPVS